MNRDAPGRDHPSRWLTLAGLGLIVVLLLYPAPTPLAFAFSLPLLLLMASGLRAPRKWGGWVAALLIPYFAGALGEAIASPDRRALNWAVTVLTVVTFLCAFVLVRRTGVDLRR